MLTEGPAHVEAAIIRKVLGYWTSANTTVAVIGAYRGATVSFVRMVSPEAFIHAVEPQEWAARHLRLWFADDLNIAVHPVALGLTDGEMPLYEYETDACSLIKLPNSRMEGKARVVDARRWFREYRQQIKFVIMNCEGYEYYLLPYLAVDLQYAKVLVQEHRGLWPEPAYSDHWVGFKKALAIGSGWVLYE